MPKAHDYQRYDANTKYNYRKDLVTIAAAAGFDHISQALVAFYRQTKSLRKTAKAMGWSSRTVAYHLKQIGEPINAQGGYRCGDRRVGTVRKY